MTPSVTSESPIPLRRSIELELDPSQIVVAAVAGQMLSTKNDRVSLLRRKRFAQPSVIEELGGLMRQFQSPWKRAGLTVGALFTLRCTFFQSG